MKKLLTAMALSALACGCISLSKNDGSNANIQPNVVKDTVHQKFAVGDKTVEASDSVQCLFGFIFWGSTATHIPDSADLGPVAFSPAAKANARAKMGAYAKALDEAKADSIAAAKYEVNTRDYFVYVESTAKIKGYPVNLKGVEIIPAEVHETPVRQPVK